jgi:hypothetical protein
MQALKAHVLNGHIVVDEPTNLPEGTELYLMPLDEEDDPALLQELAASVADAKAGQLIDAQSVIAELRSRT